MFDRIKYFMKMENIPIHSKDDFKSMRDAGLLASKVLDRLYEIIIPGISTEDINPAMVFFSYAIKTCE